MIRFIAGIVIAAVVLYLFGFVYWGMGPYGRVIWKHTPNDEAAGAAILAHFPENGTYYVPGMNEDMEMTTRLMEKGPVAFVHVIAREGRPMMDPSIMVGGFFLNLVVIVLIAVLLKIAAPALPAYAARAGFVALVGLTVAIFSEGNDAVWWQITWQWKLYQAVYTLGFWLIAGVILAAFIGGEARARTVGETAGGPNPRR
jgi:hypothetical protein